MVAPADEDRTIQDILRVAAERNLRNGVTGALIKAGGDFAQVLEGPESAVVGVMGSMMLDRRHTEVRILARDSIETRSFSNWGMAQVASSGDIERQIKRIKTAKNDAEFADGVVVLVEWIRRGATTRVSSRGDK